MKLHLKVLLGLALSLMCIFTSIGYAGFTSNISLQGEAYVEPPNAIFIVGISNVQTSGATVNLSPMSPGSPSRKVMCDISFNGQGSYVSFDVLMKNGTQFNQFFDLLEEYPEMEGVDEACSYANVTETVTPGQGTEFAAGDVMTFTVTLTYSRRATSVQQRKMLYEFDFVMDSDDLTQAVSKGVTDKFADILNNRLEADVVYSYNGQDVTVDKDATYTEVINHMENGSSGNYIGNLMGADADDKALLTALFEGALTFNVGDEEVPITVMIKEKNVYDTTDKELVLYITADDLGQTWTYVPVYAAVFAKDTTGEWKQVGDIFAGEARTNNYSGWIGNGSFDTESWRSTANYYGVVSGSGINAVINGYVSSAS